MAKSRAGHDAEDRDAHGPGGQGVYGLRRLQSDVKPESPNKGIQGRASRTPGVKNKDDGISEGLETAPPKQTNEMQPSAPAKRYEAAMP